MGQKCLPWVAMLIFQRAEIREGGGPLPQAFQYLILMKWRPCDLNLAMISSLASKCHDFKVGMPVFWPSYEMKLKTSKFKVLAFWSPRPYLTSSKMSWPWWYISSNAHVLQALGCFSSCIQSKFFKSALWNDQLQWYNTYDTFFKE